MSSKVIDFSWYLNLSLCFWEEAGVGLLTPSPATPHVTPPISGQASPSNL